MALTMEQNNTAITMAVGETKTIQLKGNPTTGYSWIALESINVENKIEYVSNPHKPGMDGVGGIFTITIKATTAGEGKLLLAYRRPWAPADNDMKFTLTIHIN